MQVNTNTQRPSEVRFQPLFISMSSTERFQNYHPTNLGMREEEKGGLVNQQACIQYLKTVFYHGHSLDQVIVVVFDLLPEGRNHRHPCLFSLNTPSCDRSSIMFTQRLFFSCFFHWFKYSSKSKNKKGF